MEAKYLGKWVISSDSATLEGTTSIYAWLGGNFECECLLDGRPSSSCKVVGLEAEAADLVLWSRPRELPPTVDSTLDPMLVEVAIHVPPPKPSPRFRTRPWGHGHHCGRQS
jgi:hypothetical protein